MMTEEAKAARRAYKREWQRNNPELVRAQQERYWTKRAAAERAAAIERRGQQLSFIGEGGQHETD
jgi:hypothetical protein